MLSNTGTVSFLLYGVFIFITIAAMLFAFYQIKKGTLETSKLDKMIELFKYVIVSTAIATVTLIVADLFKEREQDIKELEYFDKYVEDVKKVDGVQERLRLSKYLSIVAPSGEIKKSWKNYYETVEIEYEDYLKLKSEQRKMEEIRNPTENQLIKAEQTQEKINMYERPLASHKISPNKTDEMICDAKAYNESKQYEAAIKIYEEIGNSEPQYMKEMPIEIKNKIDKYLESKDIDLASKEYEKYFSKHFKCK